MLPALPLRLRASCLTWRRLEPRGFLQPQAHRAASNGRSREGKTQGHQESDRGKQEKGGPVRADKKKKATSLFDELFPEQAQRRNEQDVQEEREVPRLALDIVNVPEDVAQRGAARSKEDPIAPVPPVASSDMNRNARRRQEYFERLPDIISVLVLSKASKNLVDEDFRRVIPQGKHIEGWSLERGDIIKVIPGRDSATLRRRDFYLLLFASLKSAFAYQSHVTRLHKLCQSQSPSSLLSPIPPPPGYKMGGEDIDAQLQSYSLIPPSQNISIRQIDPRHSPSVQQIIESGGYPTLVNRPGRMPVEVLLSLDGPQLTIPNIRSAIIRSSRERNRPWTGSEPEDLKITKWQVTTSDVPLLSSRRFADPLEARSKYPSGKSDGEDDGAGIEEDEEPDEYRRQRRTPAPSYIIGFQNDVEAQSFVRFWHRRPMQLPDFDYDDGDIAPIVNVEILW